VSNTDIGNKFTAINRLETVHNPGQVAGVMTEC